MSRFIQQNIDVNSGGTSESTGWTAGFISGALPAVGHTLLGCIRGGGGAQVTGITDPRGNTWNLDVVTTQSNERLAIVSCKVIKPYQAGDTLTIAQNSSGTYAAVKIAEFEDIVPVIDQSVQNNGGPATAKTNVFGSTTRMISDVLIAAGVNASLGSYSFPAGWTGLDAVWTNGAGQMECAWYIPKATGTFSTAIGWTSSGYYSTAMAAYRPDPSKRLRALT